MSNSLANAVEMSDTGINFRQKVEIILLQKMDIFLFIFDVFLFCNIVLSKFCIFNIFGGRNRCVSYLNKFILASPAYSKSEIILPNTEVKMY